MKLKHIGVGTYCGHATHLKLWVQEDDEHYVEYRADLGLALSFLKIIFVAFDFVEIVKNFLNLLFDKKAFVTLHLTP